MRLQRSGVSSPVTLTLPIFIIGPVVGSQHSIAMLAAKIVGMVPLPKIYSTSFASTTMLGCRRS
jgi:hypothetical protein